MSNKQLVEEADDQKTPSKAALVQAVFRKLPFLLDHFKIEEIDKISFRRVDAQVLRTEINYEKVLLFSKTGIMVGQVGVQNVHAKILFWRLEATYLESFKETIGEALKRLEPVEKNKGCEIYYIVSNFVAERSHIIISKPPRGLITLKKWLAHEAEIASKIIEDRISVDEGLQ